MHLSKLKNSFRYIYNANCLVKRSSSILHPIEHKSHLDTMTISRSSSIVTHVADMVDINNSVLAHRYHTSALRTISYEQDISSIIRRWINTPLEINIVDYVIVKPGHSKTGPYTTIAGTSVCAKNKEVYDNIIKYELRELLLSYFREQCNVIISIPNISIGYKNEYFVDSNLYNSSKREKFAFVKELVASEQLFNIDVIFCDFEWGTQRKFI